MQGAKTGNRLLKDKIGRFTVSGAKGQWCLADRFLKQSGEIGMIGKAYFMRDFFDRKVRVIK